MAVSKQSVALCPSICGFIWWPFEWRQALDLDGKRLT